MAAISGKYGRMTIDGVEVMELTEWTLNYGMAVEKYFSRSGEGAQKTVDGAESGSGTISMVFDPSSPQGILFPSGTLATLELMHTLDGAINLRGDARLGEHKYSANRDGKVQECTIDFDTDGRWQIHGAVFPDPPA